MWQDLSQPSGPGMDHSTALASPRFEAERTVADDGAAVTRFDAPTHAGTHVDAPAHVIEGGSSRDERDPESGTQPGDSERMFLYGGSRSILPVVRD